MSVRTRGKVGVNRFASIIGILFSFLFGADAFFIFFNFFCISNGLAVWNRLFLSCFWHLQ